MAGNYICDKSVCAKCKYRTAFAGDIACWYNIISNGQHRQVDEAGNCLTFSAGNPVKVQQHVMLHSVSQQEREKVKWDMRFSS